MIAEHFQDNILNIREVLAAALRRVEVFKFFGQGLGYL